MSKANSMSKQDALKPDASLLSKLGSLIIHYEEWTSKSGHQLDKVAIDTITSDPEVKQWVKQMNNLSLLPLKRQK